MTKNAFTTEPKRVAATERAVSFRAVFVGLGCAAFLCAVTPYNDYKVGATYLAGNQFPIGALFVLLFLALPVNGVLRRLRRPHAAFAPGELLTVWTLILVASGLPSSGLMRYFLPHIVAPQYFSNSANNWEYKVWGQSPQWLRVRDQAAANAYFTGYPHGQEHIPWEAWIGPLFFWGLLAVLFYVASFCMANVLRRQWVENEKFAFPLVALPLLLSEAPEAGRSVNATLCSPLLWLGAGLTTGLHTMNGLHQLYPVLPEITTSLDLQPFFASPPFSQIGQFTLNFYPLVVGLAYLLSAEVAFSLWFFHLFYKTEILIGAVYNWDMPAPLGAAGQKEFHSLQAFGGAVGLLLWTLWAARRHLRDVWNKAWGPPEKAARINDSGEMFGYRATLLGLFGSYAGIALWLYFALVPLPLIALMLVIMTTALVVISWVVTQAGTLFMAVPYGSLDLAGTIWGTGPFKAHAWYTAYRVEWMFFRDTRELLMPELLNGAKTADVARFDVRRLFWAMLASVGLSFVISCAASLWLPYHNGGANSLANAWAFRIGPQRPLQLFGGAAASAPLLGSWINGVQVVLGFALVVGLLALRAVVGFGLHPIGFLGASVSAGHVLWFSIFLGWLAKTLLQRYGGMKYYKAALPFFMGFIVGDVVNAAVWILLGNVTGIGYSIMPQ